MSSYTVKSGDTLSEEKEPTLATNLAGNITGAVLGDVVGETVGNVGRRYVPQHIQNLTDETYNAVTTAFTETEAGQEILEYLENNPGVARDLDAALNLTSVIPGAKLLGKSVRKEMTPNAIGDAIGSKRQAVKTQLGISSNKPKETRTREEDIEAGRRQEESPVLESLLGRQ